MQPCTMPMWNTQHMPRALRKEGLRITKGASSGSTYWGRGGGGIPCGGKNESTTSGHFLKMSEQITYGSQELLMRNSGRLQCLTHTCTNPYKHQTNCVQNFCTEFESQKLILACITPPPPVLDTWTQKEDTSLALTFVVIMMDPAGLCPARSSGGRSSTCLPHIPLHWSRWVVPEQGSA